MKCRCPYCQAVADWDEAARRCPVCGKTARGPGFFRSRRQSPRTRAPLGVPANLLLVGTGMGRLFVFASRHPVLRWILFLGAVAVVAAMFEAPRLQAPPDHPATLALARDNLATLHLAIAAFEADCGRPPSLAEGLEALARNPGLERWHGPYIVKLKPDPWGRPFRYAPAATGFELFSLGPDGQARTADDLTAPALAAPPTPSGEDLNVSLLPPGSAPSP